MQDQQLTQLNLEGKPLENKPFRWITQDEQKAFTDFLESLNLFPVTNEKLP